MSFESEFDAAVKSINLTNEKVIRATAIQLFSAIVKSTPVDTGRLRGNWQTTLSSPASGTLDVTDPSGGSATSKIESVAGQFTLADESIWFTNNLPYAEIIEEGSQSRRPYKMVATNVAIFVPILEQKARQESD